MASRRKYELLDAKCQVLSSMKDNKNIKFFGNNSDDALAQMAAYRIHDEQRYEIEEQKIDSLKKMEEEQLRNLTKMNRKDSEPKLLSNEEVMALHKS